MTNKKLSSADDLENKNKKPALSLKQGNALDLTANSIAKYSQICFRGKDHFSPTLYLGMISPFRFVIRILP